MKDYTNEYRTLAMQLFEIAATCNNALRRLETDEQVQTILQIQHEGITACGHRLMALQREENESPQSK